jgi:hypothetical protein
MADVTLLGVCTPTAPATGHAVFDNDSPAQLLADYTTSSKAVAPEPVFVTKVTDAATSLTIETDGKLLLSPAGLAPIQTQGDWDSQSISVANRTNLALAITARAVVAPKLTIVGPLDKNELGLQFDRAVDASLVVIDAPSLPTEAAVTSVTQVDSKTLKLNISDSLRP